MRNIHSFILSGLVATLLLTACQADEPKMENLFKPDASAVMQPGDSLYHLNDFVETFMTERGNYYVDEATYRTRALKVIKGDSIYLFSIDTIPAEGPGIFIQGRITTDDYGGNFYKSLVIQEIVDGQQQNLRISVDMGSAGGLYQIGQVILIRCNGLSIGKYGNQPQLCVPSYDNKIFANKAEEKIGWAPGRIPAAMFSEACTLIGTPDMSKLVYDIVTPEDFIQYALLNKESQKYEDQASIIRSARKMDGRLVKMQSMHCTSEYAKTDQSVPELKPCNVYQQGADSIGIPNRDPYANVFAPTTNNMHYPQSRTFGTLEDDTTKTIDKRRVVLVSTSEFAKYANYLLPDSAYAGDITGILGFYMDNGGYDATQFNWSISLRCINTVVLESLVNDLSLKDAKGNIWYPAEFYMMQ